MPWFKSPVKLFAYSALLLFVLRLVFPPADSATQLHFSIRFFDWKLDLTGYGVSEFVALVFALSALVYYLASGVGKYIPNGKLVQIHLWPSVTFAGLSVYLTHWVSRLPTAALNNPLFRSSLNNWLTSFAWVFVVFLLLQIVFAIGAFRCIWRSRIEGVQV